MSQPANKLDKYTSYTYHFELHCAATQDELTYLETWDSNATTTPYQANGTLLINTRKDAHQVIDHLTYSYISPQVNPTFVPVVMDQMKFTITEPGGISFLEKMVDRMAECRVTTIGGIVFMLKIFFVGRYSDNTIETTPATILYCNLVEMTADFTQQGGVYVMKFVQAAGGSVTNEQSRYSTSFNYSNKAVVLHAKTVTEAIAELEKKLNENYSVGQSSVETDARRVKYKINLDPRIRGDLSVINLKNYSPSSTGQMAFPPQKPIIDMIRQVILSSKEVNEMIAESRDALQNDFHEGVKIPTFSADYVLETGQASVIYNVYLYTGGNYLDDVLTFDFYFSEAGKNVDIIDFDIKFTKLIAWLQNSMHSVAYWTNQDAETASRESRQITANAIHENTTRARLAGMQNELTRLDLLTNDVLPPQASPRQEIVNHVSLKSDAAPSARMAFQTYGEFMGAVDPQMAFTIRGNYDLLQSSIMRPGSSLAFGMTQGMWLKVNIFDRDGRPFFYTGYYRLLTVENILSDGKFTQKLTVLMDSKA